MNPAYEKHGRAHYHCNRALFAERVKTQDVERRAFLASIKTQSGCTDCGYNYHPAALQFDHVRGEKLFDISQGLRRKLSVLLEEIAKCEVVCANCHAVRGAERRRNAASALAAT